jgi:hypothetical protein
LLVDHRTYFIKPTATQQYFDTYEKYGYRAQVRHLGEPIAYLFGESGEVNDVVHLWAYEDAADRAKKRTALFADAEWKVYLQKLAEGGLLMKQTTKLMIPASFTTIKR